MTESNKPLNTDSEQVWEPGQLLLGDFEVQRVLGQGGMGRVYHVRSRTTAMEFAVKRALIKNDNSRQNFLSELQTWIDLPEHPNIAACRFFRTIGDEIAIFAEYASGGTLADWIRDRRLTTLEKILDVAIQFAWGLHALHQHGLIHQDVKPGNVLMTTGGIAKVTDFGLARARLRGGDGRFYSPVAASNNESMLANFGGMTRAYCSPEQAQIEAMWKNGTPLEALPKLSRRTDVWSWGVSLLDIFYGEVSCGYGQTAGQSLEAYFRDNVARESLPRMPVEMTMVLGKCFQPKPEHRWKNISEAADALILLSEQTSGRPYHRQTPIKSSTRSGAMPSNDRRTTGGMEWSEPLKWLRKAFRAAGYDPAKAELHIPARTGSRRAQAIADMVVYEEAYRIFERLVAEGQAVLEDELAALCREKAFIHENTGDSVGAVELFARAIEILQRQVTQQGRAELESELAMAYADIASASCNLFDKTVSVTFYNRSIEIYERLVQQEGKLELLNSLAAAYMNKGSVVSALGDKITAVALYDHAIEIRERLVNGIGRSEVADDLATAYMNKAVAVKDMGDAASAVAFYDRAIEILERLGNQEKQRKPADNLAMAYVNKAMAVNAVGDSLAAVVLYDRAIEIWERLVNQEGQREFANNLATTYMGKAVAMSDSGDKRSAVAVYDRAIEIKERLVNQEGQRELADDLAMAYMNKATAVCALGDKHGAVALYDRAIEIYERLVNQEEQRELANDLATVYMNKAVAVSALGDKRAAVALYDHVIEIRERLVGQEERRELLGDLAWAKGLRAEELISLGERSKGMAEAQEAIESLRAEVARTGQVDLQRIVTRLTNVLSKS
ncbi:MAG TPA: serine/threonine-protein kinase [Chthoniobacterales bacterium]